MPKYEVEWTEKVHFKKIVTADDKKQAETKAIFDVEIEDETGRAELEVQHITEVKE